MANEGGVEVVKVHRESCSANLLFVEKSTSGHRYNYLRIVTKTAQSVTNKPLNILIQKDYLHTSAEDLRGSLLGSDSEANVLIKPDLRMRHIRRYAKTHKISHIYFLDGDRALLMTPLLGLRPHFEITYLLMRSPRVLSRHGIAFFIKSLAVTLISHLPKRRILHLASVPAPNHGSEILYDPVDLSVNRKTAQLTELEFLATDQRFWFAVLGTIDTRKNLFLILRSLRSVRPAQPIGFLIMGKISEEFDIDGLQAAIDEVKRLGVDVRVIDRRVTDVELDSAILLVDCVIAAHSNDGPSGILAKAMLAGTYAVCAGSQELRRAVHAYGSSLAVWTELDVTALAAGLQDAVRAAHTLTLESSEIALRATPDAFAHQVLGNIGTLDRVHLMQLILSDGIGGAETQAKSLAQCWDARNVSNEVVELDPAGSTRSLMRRIKSLNKQIEASRPTAIVAHSAIPSIYARLAKSQQARIFPVLHSAGDDYADPKLRLAEFGVRRRATAVIAVSEIQRERYIRYFGTTVPIHVIENGVPNHFSPAEQSQQPQNGSPRILTLARVAEQKNPRLWLSVAANVNDSCAEAEFHWMGPVEANGPFSEFPRWCEGSAAAFYDGVTDDAASQLAQSDIFFLPSDREAHSLAIIEAAACGIPVICSRDAVSGRSEAIPAKTFDSGDVEGATSAVLYVLENIESLALRAQDMAPWVAETFAAAESARRYLDVVMGTECR